MALQMLNLAALTCIVLGINILLKNDALRARWGSVLVAVGITIGSAASFFLYKNGDGNNLIFYPALCCLIIVGCIVSWFIAVPKKRCSYISLLHLAQIIAGAAAMLVGFYWFQNIVNGGLAFPADAAENLPGFVFIFGNFGHADTCMMVVGMACGAMCVSSGIIAWIQFSNGKGQWTYKGYKWVASLLLMIWIGYCAFVVWQVPITTGNFGFALTATDGLEARAGVYDVHMYLFYSVLPLSVICGFLLALHQPPHRLPVLTALVEILGGVTAVVVGSIKHQNTILEAGVVITVAAFLLMLILQKGYKIFLEKNGMEFNKM